MLTLPELTDAREKLRQADILIAAVRAVFISGNYAHGARVLNDILGLLADQLSALDKAIGAGTQP